MKKTVIGLLAVLLIGGALATVGRMAGGTLYCLSYCNDEFMIEPIAKGGRWFTREIADDIRDGIEDWFDFDFGLRRKVSEKVRKEVREEIREEMRSEFEDALDDIDDIFP